MGEHVLAVAGSEEQSAEGSDLFLAHVVDSEVEDNLVAFFGTDAVDFLGYLGDHFLDSCRMDSSVLDKALQRYTCNLLADRVEAGNDDRFRCIVDDDVGTGEGLEGSDVPSLAADDAALHFIRRQVNGADRAFGNHFGCKSLDGCDDDVAGSLVCLGDGFLLDLVDQVLTVAAGFVLHLLDQQVLGFLAGHACDTLDLRKPFCLALGDLFLTGIQFCFFILLS